MNERLGRARRFGRVAAATALGIALGSLPFVHYGVGVGHHHAPAVAAEVRAAHDDAQAVARKVAREVVGATADAPNARPARPETGGFDHASHTH